MKVIFIVLLALQLIAIVHSQGQNSNGASAPNSDSIQPTSSLDPSTSSPDSHSSASQTDNPSASVTPSNTAQSSDQVQTTSPTTSITAIASSTHSDHSRTQDSNSQAHSSAGSATIGPTASSSPSDTSGDGSKNDNVGKIAGGVVGGVVGIALIGGILTWLNRRGGCTSRTKRRHHDNMDDFALHTNDKMEGGGSPFQRRMAPLASPSTTGYMNMGNDDMNRMAGYPSSHVPDSQYGYSDAQLHSPFDAAGPSDPWQQQEKQEHYNASSTSLQSPNVHDRRVKPDTVDYKPHEI